MLGKPGILSLFPNLFNEFNKTGALKICKLPTASARSDKFLHTTILPFFTGGGGGGRQAGPLYIYFQGPALNLWALGDWTLVCLV